MEQRTRGWKSHLKRLVKVVGLLALLGVVWLAYLIVRPPTLPPVPPALAYTFPQAQFDSPDNAWHDYIAAVAELDRVQRAMTDAEMLAETESVFRKRWTWRATDYPAVKSWVFARTRALLLARQGIAKNYCVYVKTDSSTSMPYLSGFRKLAWAFWLEGKLKERDHNLTGAVDSYLAALELGTDICQDAPLIGRLTGFAVDAIEISALQPLLESGMVTDVSILRRVVDASNRLHREDGGLHKTARIEYAQSALTLLLAAESFPAAHEMSIWLSVDDEQSHEMFGDAMAWVGLRLQYRKAQLELNQAYQDTIAGLSRESQIRAARQPGTMPGRQRRNWYVQLVAPVWEKAELKDRQTRTDFHFLELAAAVRLYEIENHSFPNNLNDLVPKYMANLPKDPFAPQSTLNGRRDGADFILWSVGTDGKDDNATPALTRMELFGSKPGDYVWRLEAAQ